MTAITLKHVTFSNMFSYGENNEIALNKHIITQLDAINGVGKTSIALIIQELLYSKNTKGVKKSDILNRYSKAKQWSGSLDFAVNDDNYVLSVKRTGASTKVELLKNGVDISEHKVVDTYKKLQDIIGLDFEVFSQITYQSSTDLLDFLKATDTNRKKFLINLFNLEEYIAIGERIKARSSEIEKEQIKLQGELKSIEDFLNSTTIPETLNFKEEITVDTSIDVRVAEIYNELQNINDTCKRIDKNNMHISERDGLTFDLAMVRPEPFAYTNEYQTLKLDLTSLNNDIQRMQKEHDNVKINDSCPACGQMIDNSHLKRIQQELQDKINISMQIYNEGLIKAKQWSEEVNEANKASRAYNVNQDSIRRFESLTQVIDTSLPTKYPDYDALLSERNQLAQEINDRQKLVKEITEHNKRVSANNAKVEALKEQKSNFIIRQDVLKIDILNKSSEVNALSVLKKAFSTSGIVAFKLESLTKELETTINYYLSILSDGQFQIEFILDKEKLNINVINNGVSSAIETVSGGEFSRIQTSILLAIRKLLAKLGRSSVNLLFLDEIMGVLDDIGKEKLIEVLQEEKDLNVFLISHEFTHPLIEKISINKIDNISCIQS